jgi:cellulose synthase/poly-beta-1,6-N-acetylglucosamine synthase-like glycosyltransferase
VAFVEERGAGVRGLRRPAVERDRAQAGLRRAPAGAQLRARQPLAVCPELDCLRHRLPPGVIAAAEQRAAQVGVGADRVVVGNGAISDDAYALALAASLGTIFNPLDEVPRTACPLSDARLLEGVAAGLLPFDIAGERVLVVSLRGLGARNIAALLKPRPQLAGHFHITTDQHLRRFVLRAAPRALGQKAADELKMTRPEMSAGTRMPRGPLWTAMPAAAAAAMMAAVVAAPAAAMAAVEVTLSFVFLAWTGFRVLGAFTPAHEAAPSRRLPDDKLPVYTIIVALYREAACVPDLVRALNALDYPREKLDVKFAIEPDDAETLAALQHLRLPPSHEVIIAPAVGPRTKPKALNAALPFARGSFVVVYDAEDRPDPDQLRKALAVFLHSGERLACVQARLAIDNTRDSWLARMCTAEYAGLFDVLLPGLAKWKLPLPLGGTSNHFDASVLRRIGGWDPYNVTEDADLGMRLARRGYLTSVISSSTQEEAPARFRAWLPQRTRWFKGWMQTYLVHMRRPRKLWRDLGAAGFAAFQLVIGGTVLAALVHPFFLTELACRLLAGNAGVLFAGIPATTLAAGYAASGLLALLGLKRRGLLASAWVLLAMPAHWLLLSLAVWRALYQLARDPYRWEKTEHGLAKTSRVAEAAPRAQSVIAAPRLKPAASAPRTDTSRRMYWDFPARIDART